MEEHRIEVRSNIDRTEHAAYCSCGFIGLAQPTAARAERDGDWHVIYMLTVVGE